ncbi:beta-ketoacyl synthase [Colletotrichum karsti]|uniref:Beta-ketoacyl synthase n=1 Tax=Colletotrichum karsti TaxID=1095194 RepID=A0A9P6LHR8_9PEZI|nr:beta-ketoacyl synthase [Colletotrichum karsti]KAF9873883.1 beta-ketoacyl synthase [Colletotrichum karsti]
MQSVSVFQMPSRDSLPKERGKIIASSGTVTPKSNVNHKPSPRKSVLQSVSKWLPPRDEHSDYWWNLVGPHFATLFRNADYTLEDQYEYLLFVHHHVVPRLGNSPNLSGLGTASGDSGLSLDGTHIEYSWRWNESNTKPEIRMVMEPFSRFAGTYMDPLNLKPATEMLYAMKPQIPSLDMSLFNHFIGKFYDAAQHKYLDTNERSIMTNVCLGFEFLGHEILPKAYFFPRKLGQVGLTPMNIWEEAISTAVPETRTFSKVFSFVKNDAPKLGLTMTPLWLGIDVVKPANARIKFYCVEARTSFESVQSILTMGGMIKIDPVILDNAWELMKAVCNLPADFPRNKDLPRAPRYNVSTDGVDTEGLWGTFAYYFDIGLGREELPDVKFYIPVCHYGADDEAIASAITNWMEIHGRGQYVDAYWDSLHQIVTHRKLKESRGVHMWLSMMAYVSAVTDENCITISGSPDDLLRLSRALIEAGFIVQQVGVDGRFHHHSYAEDIERLADFISQAPDLRFSFPRKLLVPVRSATSGNIIGGDLVRHMLENTLLKPVEWYKTLTLATASLNPGYKFIAMAGISTFAVVGMAGRFPGANSVDELWDLISTGGVTVSRAPERVGLDELPEDVSQVKWWGNFLDEYDAFDHKFFNKSAREATACDPQQRKLLEVVYEALESSGQLSPEASSDPSDYGCYIGAVMNNYASNLTSHPPTAYATTGTGRSYLSGAVSHHFGWTGPAMTIDTACSSSLVAIHTACRAIASGECSRAVAGGTNIITCPHDYRDLKAAGFLSPSGQCKPFDASADGYCRGEAVAVVVLKSLSAAIEEHDHILGVIVGSATSQNHKEGPIVVPNAKSQANLLRKVMDHSNISPENVTYVEAHGTGTSVGDPIEVSSLREAFGKPSRDSTLYFSSIKGNIGHAEAASGAAGLIKAILMLKHGQIPPQASYHSLNPSIPELEPDGLAIPEHMTPWRLSDRVACVNNYGAAGSNAVVMIREAPVSELDVSIPAMKSSPSSKWPLILTASTEASLTTYAQKLLEWLRREKQITPDIHISDILFNLCHRANHSLGDSVSTSVSSISDLESTLSALATGSSGVTTTPLPKPVILVFGGQESRFVGLSEAVYWSSHIFRHHLDICHDMLLGFGLEGLFPAIFQPAPISNLVSLHTALFAIQYSCAKSWMDCGLKIDAVIGHSFGQLSALCISGALSLRDAIKLVAGRASIVNRHWGHEAGTMLALQADRGQIAEILDQVEGLEVACFNGPRSHVLVGFSEAIERVENLITGDTQSFSSVRHQRLDVTHGFHSRFSESSLPALSELAEGLQWNSPMIHLEICSETRTEEAPDSRLVVEHMRRPVYFQHAVERLMRKYPRATWLEAGRGLSATQLVRACAEKPENHSFMAPQLTAPNAQDSLVDVTVRLWKEGHSVQYWPFHRSQRRQYQHLSPPPYQFQKTRHWLPYIRAKGGAEIATNPKPEQPKSDEFITLIKGNRSTEACFRVSATSDRFQALITGHVMCGHAVMPASAYIEIASRAVLLLQEDPNAARWVPIVEDLTMKAPVALVLGQDPPKITMTLQSLGTLRPAWSFTMKVELSSGNSQLSSEAQDTTTGTVLLHEKNDRRAGQEFGRFDGLIGDHRWEQLMNHPDAEAMHGKHIYRAFNQIVQYSDSFRGIKAIASLGNEAAGQVKITTSSGDPPDQRLTNAPMIDSFMQFGGFLVNYFNEAVSPDDLLVCHHIQRLQFGPSFSPDSEDWLVFANKSAIDQDNISVDVYVSGAKSRKTVLVALGMEFTRMSRSSLTRLLSGSTKGSEFQHAEKTHETGQRIRTETIPAGSHKPESKCHDVLRIAASIADVPEEKLSGEECLPDIGVDSLGSTEMISDIASALNVTIDLSTFLLFPDINAIIHHVDTQLGLDSANEHTPDPSSAGDSPNQGKSSAQTNGSVSTSTKDALPNTNIGPFKSEGSDLPVINSISKSFDDVRLSFDQLGAATQALGYWSDMHPDDVRLVLAYVTEAFTNLGCDLRVLEPGMTVPNVTGVLSRHTQLVQRLYQFLEDEGIIEHLANGAFTRSDKDIEATHGEQIFHEIIGKHPSNVPIRHLLHAVGPHLASCLVGEQDALQVLFGNRANKKWLDDLYRDWPMLVTATQLLGKFLCRAFKDSTGSGPFRILEVGAGTGGTTRHIVDMLTKHGIPFAYHFTDLSASLVQKAKTSFADVTGMSFGVLDIEQDPAPELTEAFHVIISTNCIHATRNITSSLSNLRTMLREDGALALIEMTPTRQLYVFDIIVGLLEGWWLFDDGRTHALADAESWGRAFADAGFPEVRWSDGESLEARTVRVICGFRKLGAPSRGREVVKDAGAVNGVRVQELVYKTVGSREIYADVYCPLTANPAKKMPIALMIHGGSHIIFSRKDIRPPQTRIMLDMGLLPVSLDHRLCPETRLAEGPVVDVCDALEWARTKLPYTNLINPDVRPDPDNIVVVGWSSGGQLALSTGWTAPERGLKPPNAILGFYCPTDYEDDWWQNPIQPIGAEDQGEEYDVLAAVQDSPVSHTSMSAIPIHNPDRIQITNYTTIGAWEPLSDPRIRTDPRARIVLHMNWKAQSLPVIIGGLPSRRQAASSSFSDWNTLPQPPIEDVRRCSPLAQVRSGTYKTPTFLVHGTADDLIPWQQSARTAAEMEARGVEARLVLVEGAPHVCDASRDGESEGWRAVREAYRWLGEYAFSRAG